MTAPLVDRLLPVAAELVGTVRDYGPDDVAAVLSRVPEGRHDALSVVLAAMVDPDKTPGELLAWLDAGPVRSRARAPMPARPPGRPAAPREHGSERGYQQHRARRDMPACGPCLAGHRDANRRAEGAA